MSRAYKLRFPGSSTSFDPAYNQRYRLTTTGFSAFTNDSEVGDSDLVITGSKADPRRVDAVESNISKLFTMLRGTDADAGAAKLRTPRSIGITGDFTWTVSFDGSANVTGAATLVPTGITPGTYDGLTVDAAGRITAISPVSSRTALQNEIDAVEAAAGLAANGAYIVPAGSNYLANATSLANATTRLDAQLKTVADLVGAKGGGTVTSVALSGTEFTFSGSPITNAGTIAVALANTGVTAGTYNSVTVDAKGRVTAATNVAGSGGEANTGSNLGTGKGVFAQKSGLDLQFRSLIAGTNITIANTATDITISAASFDATALQTEIDAIESGAGLNTNGTYTANASANYTATAISLKDADNKLDARLKVVSDLVASKGTGNGTVTSIAVTSSDITVSGSPITTSGTITLALPTLNANVGTYTNATVTVDAKGRVTAVANGAASGATFDPSGLQSEIDAIESGAGLSTTGTYVVPTGTNYLGSSTTLADADKKLDAQIKIVADSVATKGNGTVTSVSATGAQGITVAGSPVTTSGTLAITLANTTVTAGAYTNANITIDAQGRITAAANGTAGGGGSTFDPSGLQSEIDAIETGAGLGTDGTYSANTSTNYLKTATSLKDADSKLDAQIKTVADLAASKGSGTVTSVAVSSTDLTVSGSPVTSSGTINLALPTVNSNVGQFAIQTVNAKGLVTAATNLSATGDVTGTSSGASIALTLATVAGVAGTYTNANITVDSKGRITSVASGAAGGGGSGTPLVIKDEGTQKTAAAASINFTGAGVTATDDGAGNVTVAIPGGGSGGTSTYNFTQYEFNFTFDGSGNVIQGNIAGVPSGWTVNADSTSQITITHNQGKLPQHVTTFALKAGKYTQKFPSGNPTIFGVDCTMNTCTIYGVTVSATNGANSSIVYVRVVI